MAKADGMPEQGMYFEQARRHAKRFAKGGDPRLTASAINQVRVAESIGAERKGASAELEKEIRKDYGKNFR